MVKKKLQALGDRLHNYLCAQNGQCSLQVHHSHIDINKLKNARILSFLYITGIYIWVLAQMSSITTNFIYLTLQGYLITWLFYAVALQDYLLTKHFGIKSPISKKLKHYVQILYQTALCFEFPITIVFWTFLFPILLRQQNVTTSDIIMNANLHAGPLICLLIDLYYNTFNFPKRHLWVLTIYGTGYMLINLVYSTTVKIIYAPIDWKSVLSYVLLIMSYVFVITAHYLARFVHRKWKAPLLKNRITQGLIQQKQSQINPYEQKALNNKKSNKTTQQSEQINLNDKNRNKSSNNDDIIL